MASPASPLDLGSWSSLRWAILPKKPKLSAPPMHVGFTSDQGGNAVNLRWFKHKSNLHHVWDREIILTTLAENYGKDMDAFRKDLEHNITKGAWSDETSSWGDCADLLSCPTKYATESIGLACKWGYNGVNEGDTLSDDYFASRLPIVERRIAQGGVRLAMFLNRVFGEHKRDVAAPMHSVADDELGSSHCVVLLLLVLINPTGMSKWFLNNWM